MLRPSLAMLRSMASLVEGATWLLLPGADAALLVAAAGPGRGARGNERVLPEFFTYRSHQGLRAIQD